MIAVEAGLAKPLLSGSQSVASLDNAVELSALQRAFQVESLGDGNRMAGVNQLAAMALTLANLARPGSCIVTPEGRRLQIGCNLLATGPLVTSAILDEVVTPVRRCQDTLLSQLNRLLKADKAEEANGVNRRWKLNGNPKTSAGEEALFDLMAGDPDLAPLFETREGQWVKVVTVAPSEGFDDLTRTPRVFIAAPTPKLLEKQLSGAHLGQPLVAVSLNHASDATKLGDLCPSLIDGLLPAGASGETVSGRLLVTDARGLLREVATTGDDKSAWLGRLLWLIEGNAGPELPLQKEDNDIVSLPNLNARFERAIKRDFANRLNTQKPGSIVYKSDFAALQARWMGFLTNLEKSCPGIAMVARRLLPSLVFGLRRLVTADQIPSGFHYSNESIETLARLLVQRMANHRASILFSATDARRMRDKRRIFDKLAEGSLDARSVYHPLHLGADYCRELLTDMEADNLVALNGSLWKRIEGRTLAASSSEHLQLEV